MTIYGLANHQKMLGQHEAAESGYRMALAICTSDAVVPSPESRCLLTMIHHALGVLAYEQRRWKSAEEHFQKSLSISVESDNQPRQAESFRFLGRVAARVHDWPRPTRRTNRRWTSMPPWVTASLRPRCASI